MDLPDPDSVIGFCDGYERGHVRGWAWYPNRPHESVIVEILIDGVAVVESAACIARPDLKTAGIGQGRHAFAIPLELPPDAPAVMHVEVRAKGGPPLSGGAFDIATSDADREAEARLRSTAYLESVFGSLGPQDSPPPPRVTTPPKKLNFILYSATAASGDVPNALGAPEYSYFFVMREFREVLRRLGVVHMVRDPAREVDAIYEACAARGETCLYFSFAPPHHTVLGLRAPTIPVIAWEYSSIPDQEWDGNPRHDWRFVLRQTGRAITISGFAAGVIRDAMGPHFPAIGIPTPVWDRLAAMRARIPRRPRGTPVSLSLDGFVWDSRTAAFSLGMDLPPLPRLPAKPKPVVLPMRGFRIALALAERVPPPPAEPTPEPAPEPPPLVLLPRPDGSISLRGRLRLTAVLAVLWYQSLLRPVLPRIVTAPLSLAARQARRLRHGRPAPLPPPVEEPAPPPPPPEFLAPFPYAQRGMCGPPDPEPLPPPALAELFPAPPAPAAPPPRATITLDGIVFANVLAPKDGRKNWQDLTLAFTDAFRDTSDATLVLKMIGADPAYWWWEFHDLISRVPPFACRVVVLHGYLDDANYQALIGATHFVTNTSLAEGQCLPLVEFMSGRRPAIAPRHTAMLDYITPENALIVASEIEFCSWPHDPRNHLLTTRHRIEYPSLITALREAWRIATEDPAQWDAMAEDAAASMQRYCGDATVAADLADLLSLDVTLLEHAGLTMADAA